MDSSGAGGTVSALDQQRSFNLVRLRASEAEFEAKTEAEIEMIKKASGECEAEIKSEAEIKTEAENKAEADIKAEAEKSEVGKEMIKTKEEAVLQDEDDDDLDDLDDSDEDMDDLDDLEDDLDDDEDDLEEMEAKLDPYSFSDGEAENGLGGASSASNPAILSRFPSLDKSCSDSIKGEESALSATAAGAMSAAAVAAASAPAAVMSAATATTAGVTAPAGGANAFSGSSAVSLVDR